MENAMGVKRGMMPEIVVAVAPRRRSNDCGVWAIHTLTGVPYADVAAAAQKADRWGGERGLYLSQIIHICELLGFKVRKRKRVDLEDDTGILSVWFSKRDGHVVVLREGELIDADGTSWKADDYIAAKRVRVSAILLVEPKI